MLYELNDKNMGSISGGLRCDPRYRMDLSSSVCTTAGVFNKTLMVENNDVSAVALYCQGIYVGDVSGGQASCMPSQMMMLKCVWKKPARDCTGSVWAV